MIRGQVLSPLARYSAFATIRPGDGYLEKRNALNARAPYQGHLANAEEILVQLLETLVLSAI